MGVLVQEPNCSTTMSQQRAKHLVGKKSSTKTPPTAAMLPVLAVHKQVSRRLNDWSSENTWNKVAVRFLAILNHLRAGKVEEAEVALNSLLRRKPHIKNSGGVLEYGNVQNGGAPRIFVLKKVKSYFFVAAGLEEGSSGCPEIDDARTRGLLISSSVPQPSVDKYRIHLGPDYEVSLIPGTANKEKP